DGPPRGPVARPSAELRAVLRRQRALRERRLVPEPCRLAARLPADALLLGLLNFCQFAPVLLLAPWTGSAADRFNRRRLLLIAQATAAGLAATLSLVAWSGAAEAWVVIAFALGLGVTSAISIPPQQALLASLVEPPELPTAV